MFQCSLTVEVEGRLARTIACGQPIVGIAAPQYCPLVAQEGGMKAASGSDKLSYTWWRKWTNKDILGRLIDRRLMLVLFLIAASSSV